MHGHGDKPYLCTYERCDRAMPGNGFPRQWNLKDHMRRVHNDNGSSLNLPSASPPTAPSSVKGRKRKGKESIDSTSSRKQSSKAAQAIDEAAAAKAMEQPMFEQWNSHHQALNLYLQEYSAADAFDYAQQLSAAQEHLEAMGRISQKLRHTRKSHSKDAQRRSHGRLSG